MEDAFSKYINTPENSDDNGKKQPFDGVSPVKNGDFPLPFFGVSET